MRKILMAANWKMNHTTEQTNHYFDVFTTLASKAEWYPKKTFELVFASSFTSLMTATQCSKELAFQTAAQNVHAAAKGAYTGEISIPMLKELAVQWVILGHSERRQFFAETDEAVAKKALACMQAGLKIIVCVGESKEQRQAGKSEEIVSAQLKVLLEQGFDSEKLLIAYEPIWAIGTGEASSAHDAQKMHQMIRQTVTKASSKAEAEKVRILYGGSMNESNCQSFLQEEDIDGGLIGGASLHPEGFMNMLSCAAQIKKEES